MPLVSDGKGKAVADGELRAIGFWMSVKGPCPSGPFVSSLAMRHSPSPFDVRDLDCVIAKRWLELHESGTLIRFTEAGAALLA